MDAEMKDETIIAAEDLAVWVKTPAGKATIEKLERATYTCLNQVFNLSANDPDMHKLLSAIAHLQANTAMLRRFTGAVEDAKEITRVLSKEN